MDDGRFELALERLLLTDFSAGTETFRDELLARCLAELGTGTERDAGELDDADLELLAAGGAAVAKGRLSEVQQDGS